MSKPTYTLGHALKVASNMLQDTMAYESLLHFAARMPSKALSNKGQASEPKANRWSKHRPQVVEQPRC